MSSNAESSSDRLADGTAADDAQSMDAADAAGVGDIRWATEVQAATGQRWRADGPAETGTDPTNDQSQSEPSDQADAGTDESDAPSADATDELTSEPGEAATDVGDNADITAEDLVQDLERVTVERDQYLDASRRLQAEFENYRKAVAKREVEARERANESLVAELLPILDACDGALASGATDVEPVRTSLVDTLTKQGLTRIDDAEAPFDPERHEAVMHEPDADGDGDGPVVAEVMRAGYLWKGRVVRPAMVRVRG